VSQLPIADSAVVRAYAREMIRHHRGELTQMLALYALAAVAALVPAWVIGHLTNLATAHELTSSSITLNVAILFGSSLAYAGLSFLARRRSYILVNGCSRTCARGSWPACSTCRSPWWSAPAPGTC
jgi:hypothetical protein